MKKLLAFALIAIAMGCGTAPEPGEPETPSVDAPATEAPSPAPQTEEEEFAALFGDDAPHAHAIDFNPPFTDQTVFPLQVCLRDPDYLPEGTWEKGFRFWEAYTGRKIFELAKDQSACNVIVTYSTSWHAGRAYPFLVNVEESDKFANMGIGDAAWFVWFDALPGHTPYWRLVAHETGHLLGFKHSDQEDCIMTSTPPDADTGCDLSPLLDAIADVEDAPAPETF